jgi:hypothetical protein
MLLLLLLLPLLLRVPSGWCEWVCERGLQRGPLPVEEPPEFNFRTVKGDADGDVDGDTQGLFSPPLKSLALSTFDKDDLRIHDAPSVCDASKGAMM